MRRESSTVVVLIGDSEASTLAELARSPNVSVARPAARRPASEAPDATHASADAEKRAAAVRPGWEPGALAMREAARRRSTYVIVPDDPLADIAASWRAMWDVASGQASPSRFERAAAEALAAWRDKQFELPDYYLVMKAVGAEGTDVTGPDMYLGPLRAVRPRRVAVAGLGPPGVAAPWAPGAASIGAPGVAGPSAKAARIIEALRSLEHGPWWPALDDLVDATRHFYAGGLAGPS